MASKKSRIAKTATQALLVLWEEGFLSSWRKSSALDTHLAKRGNHFSTPELGMALKRARYLTRRGKKGNYEYIQKHPFDPDETVTAVKGAKGK